MGDFFIYCPKCKQSNLQFDGVKQYKCSSCGWEFYQNTAAAVIGIIEFNDKVLVVERNREPGKGMLDFPGGFVDPDETAEEALQREIMEELSLEVKELRYIGSAPNNYAYKEIDYTTCDMIFVVKTDEDVKQIDRSEIAGYHWVKKSELNPEAFAFKSIRIAIEKYKG